jgi:hypothetical protein
MKIKEMPSSPAFQSAAAEIGAEIDAYLTASAKRIAFFKKWSTRIALIATIIVNVLQALGIW